MRRDGNKLFIGKVKITASRFPWQVRGNMALLSDPKTEGKGTRYGWRGTPGMGRFGGGWNWCLGFRAGGKSIYIELLVGAISISWHPEKKIDSYVAEWDKAKAKPVIPALLPQGEMIMPKSVIADKFGDDVPF